MSALPNEIWQLVLLFAEYKTLRFILFTCRNFADLLSQDAFWLYKLKCLTVEPMILQLFDRFCLSDKTASRLLVGIVEEKINYFKNIKQMLTTEKGCLQPATLWYKCSCNPLLWKELPHLQLRDVELRSADLWVFPILVDTTVGEKQLEIPVYLIRVFWNNLCTRHNYQYDQLHRATFRTPQRERKRQYVKTGLYRNVLNFMEVFLQLSRPNTLETLALRKKLRVVPTRRQPSRKCKKRYM